MKMELGLLAAIQAACIGGFAWMFKRQITRIDELEKVIRTENEIRRLINDAQKPLEVELRETRADISEMKADVKELLRRHPES